MDIAYGFHTLPGLSQSCEDYLEQWFNRMTGRSSCPDLLYVTNSEAIVCGRLHQVYSRPLEDAVYFPVWIHDYFAKRVIREELAVKFWPVISSSSKTTSRVRAGVLLPNYLSPKTVIVPGKRALSKLNWLESLEVSQRVLQESIISNKHMLEV